MDGAADATAAALGAWASVRGFFTPATLFLVVNLVIGTIALTSRSHQRRRRGNAHDAHAQHQHQHQHQEPPFLQHAQQQENHYYDHDHQQQQQHEYVPPPPAPAPLARTSSVLDRLRSIGLYRFRSGDFPPEYATATDSRDGMAAPAPTGGDAHYARSRSEPAPMPPRGELKRPAPSRMKKSSSEARKAGVAPPPAARVLRAAALEEEDHAAVYARADGFTGVNSFTTQLPPPHPQPQAPVQHEEEEEEEQYYREEYVPPVRPAPLARAPSVLERLRSFGFTGGNSFTTQLPPQAPVQHEEEEEEEEEEHYYCEEYVPPVRPAPLARAPSVLERLRSFGLSRFRSGDLGQEQAAAAVEELERNRAAHYSRSSSEPSREQGKQPKMSKSSSEARKPAAAAAEEAEEGGVDARADDFINSFRQQLQLQRLNSLLNYKEVLNRGA